MRKGLSLEELRNNLEGEAQKKVQALEEEKNALLNSINAKDGQIRHLQGDLERKDKEAYNLFNRCRALSGMTLCSFCGLRVSCAQTINKYGKIDLDLMAKQTEEAILATAAQVIMGYENNKKEEVCDNVEKK